MKKIMGLILCFAFAATLLVVPVNAEPKGQDSADIKYASGNVLYYENFEGENPAIAGSAVCEIKTEDDGNKYLDIYADDRGNNGQYNGTSTIYFDSLPADFVMTLDLCRPADDNVEFWVEYYSDSFGTTNSNGQNVGKFVKRININSWYWKRDTWYRLEYVKYPDNTVKATMIERDTGIPLTVQDSWYTETSTVSPATTYNRFIIRTDLYNNTVKYHWLVDNITLTELSSDCKDETFVRNARITNQSGKTITAIPDGTAIAKYQIENNAGMDSAVAIMAAFDKENKLLKISENEVSLSAGASVVETEIDLSDVYDELDGGRVEAYLWDSIENMTPLGKTYVAIGEIDTTEGSTTTAQIGTDSDDTKAESFDAFDRSVEAGILNLEGKHSSTANELIMVKAVGKTSGNILLATQIRTRNDGSFKKSFVINPDLAWGDTEAEVTVSAINTTAKTFDIPVPCDWNEMIEDFTAADTAEKLDEFYETYEANLSFCESGEAGIKSVGTSAFATDDFANMLFIKNHISYGEMTATETVDAAYALIDGVGEIDAFMAAFEGVKSMATIEEKTESVKTLIEECSFITFPTDGVFNMEKVYAVMAESEATNIVGFYADYEEALNQQKATEETLVDGFIAISSGQGIKQYFADNEAIIGISPDAYTDAEYEILYGVYTEKNYSSLTTSEQVNEAIVYLEEYINEYNQFLDDITDAANVTKNWETIKAVLTGEYSYISVILADHSGAVNKEYLYKRMIDIDTSSLDAIENAFAAAVEAEVNYEISVKDSFITIMDKNAVGEFFADFSDVLGVTAPANADVFLEVYNKFTPVATNFAETVEQVKNLISKHDEALGFIAEVNVKAKDGDWTGLKALYEGETSAEFIGMDTSTPLINDIRSLYLKIGAKAPFETLADIEKAFDDSYVEQQNYEELAGGMHTSDSKKYYFDETQWNITVSGSVITLSGKVAANTVHQVVIYVEDETNHPIYIDQLETASNGTFSTVIALEPELYDAEKMGTLKVSGENINTFTFNPFELYSAEELSQVVSDFMGISSKTDIKAFFEDWGEILNVEIDTEDDRVIEAIFFAYNKEKNTGKFDGITTIEETISGTADGVGVLGLKETMEKIVECLDTLTKAANEKVGSTIGRWNVIEKQVELAIDNEWINPTVSGKVSSESSMYLRMAGKTYDYLSQVEDEYEDAHKAQVDAEKKANNNGGGSSSGVGGGVSSGGSAGFSGQQSAIIGGIQNEVQTKNELAVAPFKDITEEYAWAEGSIDGLRKNGIIKGDGNGTYRPADGISREEFLTILLNVFKIEKKDTASAEFSDVDKNAWYYSAVATAYEMGIVNGYGNGEFGIGDTISRADMAVMICRTAEKMNMNLTATVPAIIFVDADSIPDYARASISKLQQANVLSGDTFGRFNPLNNLSRAEAAVAFWSVYESFSKDVDYSWVTPY